MKIKLILCGLISVAVASTTTHGANWGVKELQLASQTATEHFKTTLGEALYEKITGIAVDLNAQKVAAKAKITYNDGGVKSASYFCHEHDDEIDCH